MRSHGVVPDASMAALDAFTREHAITEQVFRALDGAGLRDYDIVQIDEYTLDLVVAWPGGIWLVYDTT